MEAIIGIFTGLSDYKSKKDDDFVDRLSSKYSVVVLVAFAIVVSMHQYVGNPINCWLPANFHDSHTAYTHSYCWVRNTYYLPFEENVPRRGQHSEHKKHIPYYQWIPFILLIQATLFYLPSVLWHGFNQKAGVDADNILAAAQNFTKADQAGNRESSLLLIRNQIDRFLVTRKSLRKAEWKHAIMKKGIYGRRMGSYLVILYLITKVLYLTNVVVQLVLLNKVLSVDYSAYGIDVLKWMIDGNKWTDSPQVAFPRVTMCDVDVRGLGNVRPYTVQCTLPINLYNEKIFAFLWFWMVFVATCTACSLLLHLGRFIYVNDRITYVRNHLKLLQKIRIHDDNDLAIRFVRSYLRQDGVFLLRLIGHNTNSMSVTEIIGALWDMWRKREEDKKPKSPFTIENNGAYNPGIPSSPFEEEEKGAVYNRAYPSLDEVDEGPVKPKPPPKPKHSFGIELKHVSHRES